MNTQATPLVQYREVNAIFKNSLVEGTTTKERTIYINPEGQLSGNSDLPAYISRQASLFLRRIRLFRALPA